MVKALDYLKNANNTRQMHSRIAFFAYEPCCPSIEKDVSTYCKLAEQAKTSPAPEKPLDSKSKELVKAVLNNSIPETCSQELLD